MSTVDKILEKIRQPVMTGRLGKRELARRAGVRIAVLHRMEDPAWNPTAETIRKLEAGLRRPLAGGANQTSVAA